MNIVGNPGVAAYYDDFMVNLFNNLKSDDDVPTIWAVTHAGHQVVHEQELKDSNINGNVLGMMHLLLHHGSSYK